MSRQWRQWSRPVLWFAAVLSVIGQSSPVTNCTSTYNWSINSLLQTPCLVAAYLESACGNVTDIPALPLGDHYLGPGQGETNNCLCSSVTYSMISACAGCQSRNFIDWPTWSQDCPEVFSTVFPETIPNVVVVPSWAYLNLNQTNNTFSLSVAEQNATETSTTSSQAATSSTSTSVSNSLTPSTTALAGPTSTSPTAGQSKSNAGAIAGGVVGGLSFLAIVAIGMLWFRLRRKRNMVQQNVAFDSRALVSGKAISQPGSIQEVSPFLSQPSQSIYTSDMSLYPGSPITTTGALTNTLVPSRRSLESVSLSVAQFGGGHQTHGNVSHGNVSHGNVSHGNVSNGNFSNGNVSQGYYTGMPEI